MNGILIHLEFMKMEDVIRWFWNQRSLQNGNPWQQWRIGFVAADWAYRASMWLRSWWITKLMVFWEGKWWSIFERRWQYEDDWNDFMLKEESECILYWWAGTVWFADWRRCDMAESEAVDGEKQNRRGMWLRHVLHNHYVANAPCTTCSMSFETG